MKSLLFAALVSLASFQPVEAKDIAFTRPAPVLNTLAAVRERQPLRSALRRLGSRLFRGGARCAGGACGS